MMNDLLVVSKIPESRNYYHVCVLPGIKIMLYDYEIRDDYNLLPYLLPDIYMC